MNHNFKVEWVPVYNEHIDKAKEDIVKVIEAEQRRFKEYIQPWLDKLVHIEAMREHRIIITYE